MKNPIRKFTRDSLVLPSFFSRYLDDFTGGAFSGGMPAVNVKESKSKYKLELSAPGFNKDDFKVEVEGKVIHISGNTEATKEEKDENEEVVFQEFKTSSFTRSFTLPDDVDADAISIKHKNGLLVLTLPKTKSAREESKKELKID